MPQVRDDWSDSEDELDSHQEGYTSVHLGVPSDPIKEAEDLLDPHVSRIGGTPAFLGYPHPSIDISKCLVCNEPSNLLVQLLCNLEDNPFERVLYVWGCPKRTCQKKNGTIRVWRSLKYDHKYAKKLQKKKERRQRKLEAVKPVPAALKPSVNPFSSGTTNPFSSNTATFGELTFGDGTAGFEKSLPPSSKSLEDRKPDEESSSDESDEESDEESDTAVEEVTSKLHKTALGPSQDWSKPPHYDPLYLETESEYIPPATKSKSSGTAHVDTGKNKAGGSSNEDWGKEAWESSQNVDEVFEKFISRIDARRKQCVRYELNGTPLFYQVEAVYRSLHSTPAGTLVPVTGASFVISGPAPKGTYNPKGSPMLPPCSFCQSPRRFEYQLMPNLINELKSKTSSTEDLMEWGTCLIFTCSKDCCQLEGSQKQEELKECWREEIVLVQWED